MVRLPDIPEQSWIQDQIDQFEKTTKGMLDAARFHAASLVMQASEIPPDFPYTGGEDTLTETERQIEEERRRQQEEADRQRAEEMARQEQELLAQQQQAQLDAGYDISNQLGIVSPEAFSDGLFKTQNRPINTAPDNTGSGVLENPGASDWLSVGQNEPYADPMTGTTEPQRLQTISDFDKFVSNLWGGVKDIAATAGQRIVDDINPDLSNTNLYDPSTQPRPEDNAPTVWQRLEGYKDDFESKLKAWQVARDAQLAAYAERGWNANSSEVYDTKNRPLLPEEKNHNFATRQLLGTALATPANMMNAMLDPVISLALRSDHDPTKPIRVRDIQDKWEILPSMKVPDDVTAGDVIGQFLPQKVFSLPQWGLMGQQLIDQPIETGAFLGILGGLGKIVHTKLGRQIVLPILGAIAGGADAAMNQRDWTGGGHGLTDVVAEAEAGAVAAHRARTTVPQAVRILKDIVTSPTAVEAYRYLDQLATKVGVDVIDQVRSRGMPAVADAMQTATNQEVPRGRGEIPSMGEGERLAREAADFRAPYATAVGAISGGVAGFETGKEDDSLMERAARIGTGVLIGAPMTRLAAREGNIAAGKMLDSMLKRGLISEEIFHTHPPTIDRVKALFALAAKDLSDDTIVDIPGGVSYLARIHPEDQAQLAPFLKSGITAGEVRRLTNDPGTLTRIYNATTEFMADAVTALNNRKQRASEFAADRATVVGLPQGMRYDIIKSIHTPETAPEVGWSPLGEARLVRGPSIDPFVKSVADDLGMPAPALYVINSPELNAAASRVGQGPNRKSVLMITQGMMDAGLNEEEMRALLKHELAHIANRDINTGRTFGYVVPPTVYDGEGKAVNLTETGDAPINEELLGTPNLAGAIPGGILGAESSDDERDRPLNTLTGVALGTLFGPKKVNAVFEKNPRLLRQAGGALFTRVDANGKLTNPGFFEAVYQAVAPKVTDVYAHLQQYQDDIANEYLRQTGTQIPAEALAAEMRRLDSSKAAAMMVNTGLKPALKVFQDLGLDAVSDTATGQTQSVIAKILHFYQNVDIAKHYGNYSNTGILADRDFPGGVKAGEAWQYIQDFENALRSSNPEQFKQYQTALRQVWDFNRQLLDMKRDAGLISADTYRQLREVYPHYVPTRIIDHITDDGFVQAGRSLSVTSNTIKELSRAGTTKQALDPLAAMIGDAYITHAYANKNRVFNGLVAMWGDAMSLTPYMNRVSWNPLTDQSQRRVGEFSELIKIMPKASQGMDTNEWIPVTGFVNGTKIKLAVHRDLGDVTKFDAPVHIPIISGIMSAFRAGATARNPVFLTANGALDFITYMQREVARDGGTPQAVGRVTWNYARSLFETLIDPRVWGDISREEFRGGAGQFYAQGGGYAGHSRLGGNVSDSWLWRTVPDGLQKIPYEQWPFSEKMRIAIGNILEKGFGYRPESELYAEMARLKRGSSVPTGAGAIAGGVAGAVEAQRTEDPDAPVTDRLARLLLHSGIGMLGGSVAASMVRGLPKGAILAESPSDIARILKDIVTLKPVEAVGERVELVPRVAAMRNAEWRFKGQLTDLNKQRQEIQASLSRAYNTYPAPNASYVQGLESRLSQVTSALEDTVKRRNIEATNAGRTTTLDFGKGGTWAKAINQFIPFFNVGVQAAADIPRALKDNPIAYASTALFTSVAPLVVAELHNNSTDEMARDYANIPNYIKDQGLVWMIPGQSFTDEDGNRHPQYVHIRYRQLAPLAVLTREILQKSLNLDNKRPPEATRREWYDAAMGGLSNVSPVQVNNPQDAWLSVIPPGISTGAQLAFNRDTFRNRDIVTKAADERASPLSKMLAARYGFNEETSRPAFWDFLTRDVGAGYAGMWHGASEIAYPGKKAPSPQNAPMTGGLYGRVVKGTQGQFVEEARDNVQNDKVLDFLHRHNIDWRPAPKTAEIRGVKLNQDEYARYQREMNTAMMKVITRLDNDPKWAGFPKDIRKDILTNLIETEQENARDRLLPQLMTKAEYARRLKEAEAKARAE